MKAKDWAIGDGQVFCPNCKYFHGAMPGYENWECCNYPKNLFFENYKGDKGYLKKPIELNKNTDCKWFTPTLLHKFRRFFRVN